MWNCGVLANGSEEWLDALDKLLSDPARRYVMGQRGRQAVEQQYSLQVQAPHLKDILSSAAGNA